MTFAIGHVQGGTNAGRKIQKPAPKPWTHYCEVCMATVGLAAHYSRCPDCKIVRPAYGEVSHTEV